MALSKGINSYATVAEADAFFEDRLDVAAWTSADATQKGQALVTASDVLDSLSWTGTVMSVDQSLSFPRAGYYFDPRLGQHVTLENAVPDRIFKASMELAYHLLNNDGLLDDSGLVNDLSIGSINLTTIRAPSLLPRSVKRLVTPLLVNAGSNNWFRSN